jgi:hypothetical protein
LPDCSLNDRSGSFIETCLRLQFDFAIVHIADWKGGKYRLAADPVLLAALREDGMIIAGFDRRTMAMHAGQLTREGFGHFGVILFRRSISQMDYGKQSRLLVDFWREAADWDWADRIEYLPK